MIQLNLNIQIDNNKNNEVNDKINKIETAKKEKKKNLLPLNEAWDLIFSRKNSASDLAKLVAVKKAIEDGVIQIDMTKNFTKAEALRQYNAYMEIRRVEILEKLASETPNNYILVQNINDLKRVTALAKEEKVIAVDTETTGVDVYRDKLVGVSLTLPIANEHFYIPIRHIEGGQVAIKDAIIELKKILSLPCDKVLHNAIFDLHILKGEGIDVNGNIYDTMIMMHLLNENEPSFRLKDLAKKYLKVEADNFDELFGKNCLFSTVALKYARYYACKDTDLTYRLYCFQLRHFNRDDLKDIFTYYQQVEMPLIRTVFKMERVGFKINMEATKELEKSYKERVQELYKQLIVYFGPINFNSPSQLSDVLYNKRALHLHMDSKFVKSTDKKALKALAKIDKGCELLLEYKQLTKELTSFIEKIPTMISPDGKLHGSFKQAGTTTGRFSSVNPNLQQQSKVARKMFDADEGHIILGADFSKVCAEVKPS